MPHQRPSGPHEEPLQAVEGLGIQHIRPGGTILQPTGHRGDSRPLTERRCVVLTVSACGCGRWRMCWPTPRTKGSSTGWTPPRSRSAGRGVRRAFVSARRSRTRGRPTTVIADDQRRTPWGLTPGDMAGSMTRPPHATTSSTPASSASPASRSSSTSALFGLRRDHPGRPVAPPGKANKISPPEVHEACRQACHQHSSRHIAVAHAVADYQRWKKLAC